MPRIRLVQTSDVHLRPDRPERRRALEQVFAQARSRAADAVIVAGDLFDRAPEALQERPAVKRMVEALAPRPVILVPGNHDADFYGSSADYGANAVVLGKPPFTRARICGIEFVGVPFQHGRTAAECLTGLATEPRHTALVVHGTLVDGVEDGFAGEGEDGAFLPIFPADLTRRCTYAALGHLHAGRNLVRREGERLIAYAGSPVTTSRRELGPRGILVVDFEPGVGVLAHEQVALATPYHERVEVVCLPGAEREAVEELARRSASLKGPGVRVLARLSGVTTEPEAALRDAAQRALASAWAAPAAPQPDPGKGAAEDAAAPSAVLELATASYAELSQIPVVAEFVARLSACAKERGGDDPRLLDTALRQGLDAFLESLP